jgi:hypothetical protein
MGATAIEAIIKAPTTNSRARLFWIISPPQLLHFMRDIAIKVTALRLASGSHFGTM